MVITDVMFGKSDRSVPVALVKYGDRDTTAIRIVIDRYSADIDLSVLGWAIKISNGENTDIVPFTPEVKDSTLEYSFTLPAIVASAPGICEIELEGVNTELNMIWQSGTRTIKVIDDLDAEPGYDPDELSIFQQTIMETTVHLNDINSQVDGFEGRISEAVSNAEEATADATTAAERAEDAVTRAETALDNSDKIVAAAEKATESATSAATAATSAAASARTATDSANTAAGNAQKIADTVERKLAAGELTGPQGERGLTGKTGAQGTPGQSVYHQWQGTTLVLTSASGTNRVNLQGPAGPAGKDGVVGRDGVDGYTPVKGIDYFDGEKGEKGDPGSDANVTEQNITAALGYVPADRDAVENVRQIAEDIAYPADRDMTERLDIGYWYNLGYAEGTEIDVETLVKNPNASNSCAMFKVAVGDRYMLIGAGGNNSRLYGFVDDDKTLYKVARAGEIRRDGIELTAERAGWLIVNVFVNEQHKIVKLKGTGVGELKEALLRKLDKPDNPAVGKILKIKSVNEDGSFVCEWADDIAGQSTDVQINGTSITQNGVANIPVGSSVQLGVLKVGGINYGVTSTSAGAIITSKASDYHINARTNTYNPIVPNNLDYAVRTSLTDGKNVFIDTEKASACQTIGAAKANYAPWKLVGTFTDTNKNDELPVDLHGCSEISVVCNGEATGNVTLCMWIGSAKYNIMYYMLTATVKSSVSKLICDGITFHQDYYRTSATLNADGLTAGGTDVAIMCNGKTFEDVSKFSFFTGNANNITSCNIKIYAR